MPSTMGGGGGAPAMPAPSMGGGPPMNVDDQVLPAIKNKANPDQGPDQEYEANAGPSGEQGEEIDAKFAKSAEPLIPIFGEPTIKKFFSKKW